MTNPVDDPDVVAALREVVDGLDESAQLVEAGDEDWSGR